MPDERVKIMVQEGRSLTAMAAEFDVSLEAMAISGLQIVEEKFTDST